MQVAVSDAKAQLTELVRRAEAGEEIVLTRHGKAAVRLVPMRPALTPAERAEVLREIRESAKRHMTPGPDAARSQDYLYGDDGLPA